MHIHNSKFDGAMTAGANSSFGRIEKLKNVISGIDWILQNDALANRDNAQYLQQVQRVLNQEIIMIEYGL